MESQVHWNSLERIAVSGILKPGDRILEIAGPGETEVPEGGLEWFVDQLATSRSDDETKVDAPVFPARKTMVAKMAVKDLLEKAGVTHQNLRVPEDFESLASTKTEDLWDGVLNFGSATSFLDQMGLFETMHNCVKAEGFLCHSVPISGSDTSSWFNYNPRLFLDTAVSNQYHLAEYWMEQSGEEEPFAHAFLDTEWTAQIECPDLQDLSRKPEIENLLLPSLLLTVICRKTSGEPFKGAIETQTSVGEIPDSVSAQYGGANQNTVNPGVLRRIARLEKELTAMKVSARKGLKILEQIKSKIES